MTARWISILADTYEHPLFAGRADRLGAWQILIAKAEWRTNGARGLDRGQLRISLRKMVELTGMSMKSVRNFMQLLVENEMITWDTEGAKKGTQGALITISNYNRFQTSSDVDGHQRGTQGAHSSTMYHVHGTVTDVTVVNEPPADGSLTPPDHQLENDLLGEEVAPKRNRSKPQPILEAYNRYNQMAERCGLPQAATLTPDLRRSIGARLREHGLDGWDNALSMIERSAFCRGENDRGWRASLTFMVRPQKFTKLISGEYGNGAHAADTGTVSEERAAQLLEEYGLNG